MAEQETNSSLFNKEGWNFDNKPNLILLICYGNHWMMATSRNHHPGTHLIHKVNMPYTQRGKNDCGLVALAYIESIFQLEDPSLIVYDQYMMRRAYNAFVDSDLSNLNVHMKNSMNEKNLYTQT